MPARFQGLTQESKVRAIIVEPDDISVVDHYFRGLAFDADSNLLLTLSKGIIVFSNQGVKTSLNGAIICASTGEVNHVFNTIPFDVNGHMLITNDVADRVANGSPLSVNGFISISGAIVEYIVSLPPASALGTAVLGTTLIGR